MTTTTTHDELDDLQVDDHHDHSLRHDHHHHHHQQHQTHCNDRDIRGSSEENSNASSDHSNGGYFSEDSSQSVTDLYGSSLELKVQIRPCSDEKILKKNLSQDNLLRADYISRPNEKCTLSFSLVCFSNQNPAQYTNILYYILSLYPISIQNNNNNNHRSSLARERRVQISATLHS